MKKIWTTPEGEYYEHIEHMTKQTHLLVAGASGSGKSVLLNTFIHTLLLKSPAEIELVLIDPKRVELSPYKSLPHTIAYECENEGIIRLLNSTVTLMEKRVQRNGKTPFKAL